jgi:hypothetical protein
MTVYRHADPRFPFLWESAGQPPARWHGPAEGPVQYFADTPDGAWAEFLRHEGITNESELVNVRRALWAIEVPDDLNAAAPKATQGVLTGGLDTYEECQQGSPTPAQQRCGGPASTVCGIVSGERRRMESRRRFAARYRTRRNRARGFGLRPDFVGWMAAFAARPRSDLLARVRGL